MTLETRRKAVEPLYQDALANLDRLTFEELQDLVRKLREAAMFQEGHNLGGLWRQNKSRRRQQDQSSSSGTSSSNSAPTNGMPASKPGVAG